MLYNVDGSQLKSERADRQDDQAREIRLKLKSIDSLLDIVYVEWAGRYSLVCKWPQGDPRWPMYERREIGDCYDSLGWFCEDMSDPQSLPVSLDGIENLVLQRLASVDNERRTWKARMADTIEHNRKVRKDRQQIALEQVEDVASTLYGIAGRVDNHKLEQILQEVSRGKI